LLARVLQIVPVSGEHRNGLLERAKSYFTLRGLVAELAERGVSVDYRTVWKFVHAERLSFKKALCWPTGTGLTFARKRLFWKNIGASLIRTSWSSSIKSRPKSIWHGCALGARTAKG